MTTCKNGHKNTSDALYCEICGVPLGTSKKRKRLILIVASFALLVGILAYVFILKPSPKPFVEIDVWEKINKTGVIRVGVEPDGAPMNYVEGGVRKGFDYELIQAVAAEMGNFKVEVNEDFYYDDLPEKAKEGAFEIFMGGYVPDPDISDILWSDGYLDFGLCLIVAQGSAIENISHLKGKKVGLYKGDNIAQSWVLSNVPDLKRKLIKEYTDDDEDVNWMDCINRGEVDAVIYDYPFAKEEVKKIGNLKIVQLNLNKSKYTIGIPGKSNNEFLVKLNAAINKTLNSSVYADIVKKYLQSDQIEIKPLMPGSDDKEYEIQTGDTLGSIAQKELGDRARWSEIWELNKDRIANPHLIKSGDLILIPKS